MIKRIALVFLVAVLLAGQTLAEAATKAAASGDPMDKVSREDILNRVNGILSHNPQILEMMPEIQKETKGNVTIFRVGGKETGSLSKDELMALLKRMNPALVKVQQERLKKQGEQILRQQKQNMQMQMAIQRQNQNMQMQRSIQQQAQIKPPAVYKPPVNQSPPASYRPPAAQSAPPRR